MADTRIGKAHGMAKRAFDAAMGELNQSDDLGIMLAAISKCAAWLNAEAASAAYLVDHGIAKRHETGTAAKEGGDD